MSHYAVAVFADDGDFRRLLAPYDENNREEFVFNPCEYDKIVDDFDAFKKANASWDLGMYIEAMGYVQNADGQWGYMSNPHGYWDWYSLDGKEYMFDLKENVIGSEDDDWTGDYRKNDYDWYPDDPDDAKEAAEFWDTYIAGEKEEGCPSIWSRQYYLERYRTKEQYVREMSRTIPYAFITPDGVWHSAGRVGWFATSDETAEDAERYAKEWYAYIESDANPYVNLVDCHI